MKIIHWTKEEIEYLKENFNIKSFEEMSSFLGRTVNAIKRKRYLMNICIYLDEDEIQRIKEDVIEKYVAFALKMNRLPGQKDFIEQRKNDLTFPNYDKVIKYFGSLFEIYKLSGLEEKFPKALYNFDYWYSLLNEYSKKSGIYKITNVLNKKIYIGQAINLYRRLTHGYIQALPNGNCHSKLLQRDWDVYGKDYFNFEIQELCEKSELASKEDYWIKYYRSYNNTCGYNINAFGSESNKSQKSPEFLKKLSEDMTGKGNPMFGKTHTPEVRKIISERQKKKVYQFSLDGTFIAEYASAIDAENATGIRRYIICQSKIGHVGVGKNGFFWVGEYDYLNSDIKEIIKDRIGNHNAKRCRVVQLDINGNIIKEFNSITEARNETGAKNIFLAIKNGYKSGGYYWAKAQDTSFDPVKLK